MRDPFAGYDQWKTASPYDDQPDPDALEELSNCIGEVQEYIDVHKEISDLTRQEELLLRHCINVMHLASEVIEESE